MTYAADSFDILPRLPAWVTSARGQTLEDVAFLSGAALSHLHLVVTDAAVPQPLLRDRLALRAAEACVAHLGRVERTSDLRDALAFLQPGDSPGPAGAVYYSWQRVVTRKITVAAMRRVLLDVAPVQIAVWLDATHARGAGQGNPVARAAGVLEAVLAEDARATSIALLLADVALSQALGWSHTVPLLALSLKRGDLRQEGAALQHACHRAIIAGAVAVSRDAADLARRAAMLRAVTPKLRAKGSDAAVALFLSRDAVAPTMLTSLQSDRARRRFCDRLVELGAARELTGRDTFRLYGV